MVHAVEDVILTMIRTLKLCSIIAYINIVGQMTQNIIWSNDYLIAA